jgi:hypothetical protein
MMKTHGGSSSGRRSDRRVLVGVRDWHPEDDGAHTLVHGFDERNTPQSLLHDGEFEGKLSQMTVEIS